MTVGTARDRGGGGEPAGAAPSTTGDKFVSMMIGTDRNV
jgi:hypothetical protein